MDMRMGNALVNSTEHCLILGKANLKISPYACLDRPWKL